MANDEQLTAGGSLTLHLLDSAQGHPVQTWQFRDRETIAIGRAPDNDISIVDPQVSRCHVLLRFCDEAWILVSIGRNGTRVDGESITDLPLSDQQVFQLGPTGPLFRFVELHHHQTANQLATIDVDIGNLNSLFIDEEKQQNEVRQIAEGDAFKQLQEQVRELRRRQMEDTAG
jgi:pSer/pThr/pTyr-binding forkhead associated (FHA) protein